MSKSQELDHLTRHCLITYMHHSKVQSYKSVENVTRTVLDFADKMGPSQMWKIVAPF